MPADPTHMNSGEPDGDSKRTTVLDQDGRCPACTLKAASLPIRGRLWWMAEFGRAECEPGCIDSFKIPLAQQRFMWMTLQALMNPKLPTPPMPHDPQPWFWPEYRAPQQRSEFCEESPYKRIKSKMNIFDVLDLMGVRYRRSGSVWRALCLFHQERTPSFTIYPDDDNGSGRFHCFGCEKSGDVIVLLKEIGKLDDFMEALRDD